MKLSRSIIFIGILLSGCCNKDFIIPQPEIDYDFYAGAKDVTSIMNSCSEEAEYTTVGATPDRVSGECWPNAPTNNRWFKFQAPATGIVYFYVHFFDTEGTIKSAVITLWDTDGTTELDCDTSFNGVFSAYVSTGDLTPGQYYYVSIDAQSVADVGSFMICWADRD
jgi:hypothetical protein